MNKIKRNDQIIVLSGKDKEKKGKVLRVDSVKRKVIVEKINIVKKHTKPSQVSPGGIVEQEKPIDISNVMLICKYCKKPVKVAIERIDNKNQRKCRKCGELIDK